MARRRSRRTRDTGEEDTGAARRSGRGRRGRKAAEEAVVDDEVLEEEEELLSDSAIEELIEDDDSADTYESVNSSKSSRGMGRRSSRRSAAASDRGSKRSARRSNRKELTPEEKAAKRKAQMAFIKLVVGLLVVAGVVVGLLYLLRPDPALERARATITYAQDDIKELDALIEHGKLSAADDLKQEIGEALDDPGFATFQDPQMMARIDELKLALQKRGPRIDQARADRAARRNFAEIKARLDAITTADERQNPTIDLDQLQMDIIAFRNNPVDPKPGATLPGKDTRYRSLIGRLAGAEGRIKSERDYRGNTTGVETEARIDIERLVTRREYKRAYKALENYKAQNPNADFSGIERSIDSSVEQAWDGVRRRVEDHMKTATSDGASAKMKESNISAAKDALQKVINDFNDTYVRRARDLMDEHGL